MTLCGLLNAAPQLNPSHSPVTVRRRQCSRLGLVLRVLLAQLPLFDCSTVGLPTWFLCQAFIGVKQRQMVTTSRNYFNIWKYARTTWCMKRPSPLLYLQNEATTLGKEGTLFFFSAQITKDYFLAGTRSSADYLHKNSTASWFKD